MFLSSKTGNHIVRECILLLVALLLFCFAPTTKGSPAAFTSQAANSTVKLSSTKKTISVGASYTLKIKNTGNKTVKWSVGNKKIAKIKKNGTKCVITGVKAGTTTVKAKVSGKTYKCAVTVKNVSLNASSKNLVVGEKCTLKLDYSGNSTVKWSSSKSSVAKITTKGKKCTVKAQKAGTTTVKAKVDGKTYKCKVKVTSAPYQSKSTVNVDVYELLSTPILKHCSSSLSVKVKSQDTSIVTVNDVYINSMGECRVQLIGISEGTTYITATVGGKSYKVKVKVAYSAEYKAYNTWRKNLEKKLWTSSMSNLDKINAVVDYVVENFSYDYRYYEATCFSQGHGGDCKACSQLIYDVATDLGLKAKYKGTVSSMIPGHRTTVVTISGMEYEFDILSNYKYMS